MEDKQVEGTKLMKRKMIVREVPRAKLIMKPRVFFPGRSLKEINVFSFDVEIFHLSKKQSARSQTDLQHMVTRGQITHWPRRKSRRNVRGSPGPGRSCRRRTSLPRTSATWSSRWWCRSVTRWETRLSGHHHTTGTNKIWSEIFCKLLSTEGCVEIEISPTFCYDDCLCIDAE